jgi:hypothetical protein
MVPFHSSSIFVVFFQTIQTLSLTFFLELKMKLQPPRKAPNEILPFNSPFIRYPMLASQKYDGFRCINFCGEQFMSPAMKPIPNANFHLKFKDFRRWCQANRTVTDGEIWSPELTFQELQSIIRSGLRPIPDSVSYYIFDWMDEKEWDGKVPLAPFENRFNWYNGFLAAQNFSGVIPVMQHLVYNPQEAEEMFNKEIEAEHEGIILVHPQSKYKHGRYTQKESQMFKFKEFLTMDGVIQDVIQRRKLKSNVNRTTNEVGGLARSYKNDDYELDDKVGAFTIKRTDGVVFDVKPGKGHDHEICRMWWKWFQQKPTQLVGKHVEFKFMPHGTMDKPRIGSLVRFRPDLD